MKSFLIFFSLVLFLPKLPGQNSVPKNSCGPVIKFDFTEIVDTISLSDIDSNTIHIRKNKYTFPFTNVGTDSLSIHYGFGTNAGYPFYYPEAPVKPGGRDSIVISIPFDNYQTDEIYNVNSNSVVTSSFRIKRVKAFDSIPAGWIENKKHAVHPGEIKFNLDTILPSEFKPVFSKVIVRTLVMDTSKVYLYFDSSDPKGYAFFPKDYEFPTAFVAVQKRRTCRYYSNSFELVYKTKLIWLKKYKDPYIGYRSTTMITEYKNGKPIKKHLEKYERKQVIGN